MPCNKPYSVQSSNPKMSGSVKPKSYQKGGMVTKPRKMSAEEFTKGMMEDPRKPGAIMRNTARELEAMRPKRLGPGTYTKEAFREREMEMAMPEQELRRKSSPAEEVRRGKVTIEELTPEQGKKEAKKELQRLLDKQRAREDARRFLHEQELRRRYRVQTA